MRVLTFLHSFDPGGVERVALRLNREWAACGHDVTVVMGRADGVLRAEAGTLAYRTLAPNWLATARWETLWMIVTLPRIVRRLRPDVIFCAGNTYTVVAVALKLILGRACPPIAAKVSNDFDRTDFGRVTRWFYRRWLRVQAPYIDRFVGIAEPMRAQIERLTGVTKSAVAIVNDPAVEVAALAAFDRGRPSTRSGRRFLAIGRLSPQKNFALALTAFARFATVDDRLTILGEGPERPRLEALARELGIVGQIALPGFDRDVAARLAEHDVFVLSSDYEGVPAVIVDALVAGIAIVATDCSVSMSDLLGEGQFGTLVRVGDAVVLADAMVAAATSRPDRAAMRSRAMHFTVEAAAPRWWRVFEALVGSRAASTPASFAGSQTGARQAASVTSAEQ